MILGFLGFELDEEQCELRRDARVIELRRKVFDVLHYLVTHGNHLVSKEELLRSVWPGETIHEAVVAQNIAILRKVLGDSREAKKAIQTVHGRGYRFVAPVVELPKKAQSLPPQARPPGASTPFVGREHTMRELRKLLQSALGGRGQFAVITGDAGIGKTRTAEELAAEATTLGARVYEGRCYEGEGAPAYWPWIQILRAAAGEGDRALVLHRLGAAGSEVAHLLSELRGHFSELPQPAPLDSAEARFRLFDGITAFLSKLAQTQPLVLIFDDLHWADEATLHLLGFLAREVQSQSLLVLATSREIDLHKSPATSNLLAGGAHVHRIYLDGLSQAATAELAAQSGEPSLSEASLRDLYALTEGNPFFVNQVLRLFADDANSARGRVELPNRVREIIALRLHGLDPRAQRLLAFASVIGRSFTLAVLEQIAGLPRAEVLALLQAAISARIVHEASDTLSTQAPAPLGHYSFAHVLIREHLYGTLTEGERARLHEQVGLALETSFGVDAEDHLTEIAHHFCRAASVGDVERAVRYCVRAAEQALALLAFEQAVFQYRCALEALACRLPIDERQRFELKLALGSAQFRAGEDGNPALLAAAAIARRIGRPELLAEVVLAMCGWPRVGRRGYTNNPAFYPLLEEAMWTKHENGAVRARLLSMRSLNGPEGESFSNKLKLSREALELARKTQDDDALYDALLSQLRLAQAPARTLERLALANELLAVAQRIGHKEHIFTAEELRVQPLLATCDLLSANAAIARCAELAAELRLPRCGLEVLRLRLERALADGRFDEVDDLTEQAVRVRGPASISPGYLVSLFIWVTFARALRGDRPWFERHIERMAKDSQNAMLMRSTVAYMYGVFGQLRNAQDCYQALLDPRLLDENEDEDWLLKTVLTADAVASVGDRAAAKELYPRLLPHAALNVAHFDWLVYFGSCAHWLGRLSHVLDDQRAAAEHFERALEVNSRLGARPALAETSLAYARMLLAEDLAAPSRAQSARGRQLLHDATAIADELGMHGLLRQARTLAP